MKFPAWGVDLTLIIASSYVIFELLKNVSRAEGFQRPVSLTGLKSFRAVRTRHPHADVLPPIRATIVAGEDLVTIRISDQGLYARVRGVVSTVDQDFRWRAFNPSDHVTVRSI